MDTTTTKAKRTPGEWHQANRFAVHDRRAEYDGAGARIGDTPNIIATAEYIPRLLGDGFAEAEANARTMAFAGTAANAVDAMGLDGDAAIAALPEMIRTLELLARWVAKGVADGAFARTICPTSADVALTDAESLLARLHPADETKDRPATSTK